MRSYLCYHNRVQPIIGLGSVIELCTYSEPPVYLCEVCVQKITKADIKTHITGSLHRYNYIKSRHVNSLAAEADLTSLAWHLMELAKAIEKKEGTGNVKVLHLDGILYKEMISKPALDGIAQVNKKFQRCTSDLRSSICNKHIKCDYYKGPSSTAKSSTSSPTSGDVNSILSRSCSPSRTLPETNVQSPVKSVMAAKILHPDGDPTVRSPVRAINQTRTPPKYTVFSEIPSLTSPSSPTRDLSSGTASRPLKRRRSGKAPEQNACMHAHTAEDGSRAIDTDSCIGIDSYLPNTEQTAKCKRVAQCQNSSLTVTITQPTNQENICEEIGEQKDLQQLRPFTPEATSFGFELYSRYSVTQSPCEFNDRSRTCTVQSPQPSEESPESYIGTQPLIGLQTVIKCQSVDGEPPPCCYLCRPCSLKLLKSDIIHHLISSQHQLNYINCHHPHLLLSMDRTQRLQTIATQLEEKEGRGQIKVTRLSACLFSEVLERDFHWCMQMLNCGSAAEIKPKHGPLMPGSSTGPSVALKWPNGGTGTTIDHSHDGTLHDPIEKVPHSQQRSSRKGVHPKKAEHKKPVFKVSLSLQAGPVVVDRMSLVSTTVAPEIECQNPEVMYRDNDALSEESITSGNHMLTSTHIEQNVRTHKYTAPYTDENSQSRYNTNTETGKSTYRYMNMGQFPVWGLEYTGTVFTGSLNRSQGPYTFYGHVHHNLFVEEVSSSSTSSNCSPEGLSAHSDIGWILKKQCRGLADKERSNHATC